MGTTGKMRTVKHQLKPLSAATEQKTKLLEVMYAYQFEKNYFSDQLLHHSHEIFNLESSYIQIRDKLVKNGYQSKYNLPARLWKMALKEAYDLHIRTHEAQVALIKRKLNNNLYQYYHFELTQQVQNDQDDKLEESELSIIHVIQCFENFLYFATNSWFFNYKTFCQFEEKYFSKKFRKARVYQRAKTLLLDLLKPSNAVKKEVLTKEEAKQLKQLLESGSDPFFNQLFQHYCHGLVKAIQKFRSFKQIQSQINPTITLDGNCYDLYSIYDGEAAEPKNRWFLDIMSMESGKRIKGLELTGFHHAKQIMKHKKSANLTLSFDPNNLADGIAAHFTFPIRKPKLAKKLTKNKKSRSQKAYVSKKQSPTVSLPLTPTATTIGGDFGLTECFTFSDGWVAGINQGEMLKEITTYTTQAVKNIQKHSKKGYFGVEKNNLQNPKDPKDTQYPKDSLDSSNTKCSKHAKGKKGTKGTKGKRNHRNNCFNHNSELKNVNRHYNKQQEKYNRRLENYKHQFMNEIIDHFTSDNIYGQYATLLKTQPIQLVFEDLDFVSLGYTKEQKRQINLIKGVLTLLEEKIKLHNLPIEIIYVNPAYTSQTCPNCGFVAKKNRDYQARHFRCQHCGFTANDDVRYRLVSEIVQSAQSAGAKASATPLAAPAADDYIASQNIAMRPSVLRDSTRLRVRKVKDLLLARHEQIKGSCKMFTCEH